MFASKVRFHWLSNLVSDTDVPRQLVPFLAVTARFNTGLIVQNEAAAMPMPITVAADAAGVPAGTIALG